MGKTKLSKEEKALLHDDENGELESILTAKRKLQLQEAAPNTFTKEKRINIRISGRDLEAIQRRALQEGMLYQTLVSSLLHKYASGRPHDISPNNNNRMTQ